MKLPIVEIQSAKEPKSLGVHEFECLPSSGDHIVLPPVGTGDLIRMRVLYVEHMPVPEELRTLKAWKDSIPHMTIYVEFVGFA